MLRKFRCQGFVLALWAFVCIPIAAQDEPPGPEPTAEPGDAAGVDTPKEEDQPAETDTEPKDDAPQDTQTAAQRLADLQTKWDDVQQQLDDLTDKYQATDPKDRFEILGPYEKLVKDAEALVPQLHEAAMAAYAENPNEDKDVLRLLVGLLANRLRDDDPDGAMEIGQLLVDHKCDKRYISVVKRANGVGAFPSRRSVVEELEIRHAEALSDNPLPRVRLTTSKGEIILELFENEAPQTVGNFVSLVEKGFYDGLTFHRVLKDFMAQAGCPNGDGYGDAGYKVYCECHKPDARKHFAGSLSMAHSGRDTGSSQFFLTFRRTSHLDANPTGTRGHTVFGRVAEGMDVLAEIQLRDPNSADPPEPDKIIKAEVIHKRDHEYKPTKVPGSDTSADPNTEDPKADDPKADDPEADDPTSDDPDKDDPDKDDPDKDDPGKDDSDKGDSENEDSSAANSN